MRSSCWLVLRPMIRTCELSPAQKQIWRSRVPPGKNFTLDPFKFIGASEFRAADLLDNNPRSAPRAGEAFLPRRPWLMVHAKPSGLRKWPRLLASAGQPCTGQLRRWESPAKMCRTHFLAGRSGHCHRRLTPRARVGSVCETTTTTQMNMRAPQLSQPPVVSVSTDETAVRQQAPLPTVPKFTRAAHTRKDGHK